MKRLVLLPAAVLLICAPAAMAARGNSHETSITIESTCNTPCTFKAGSVDSLLVAGEIDSDKQQCIEGRKVTISAVFTDDSTTKMDTDTTSGHGAFSGLGDFTGAERVRAKVAKSTFGPSGNRQTCESAVNEIVL